jgi:carbonic anhydrase
VLDAQKTIAALQHLGRPMTIAVMQHTDCGMMHASEDEFKKGILEQTPAAKDVIQATEFGAMGEE